MSGNCTLCGKPLQGRQRRFCSGRCRWRDWDRKHPRSPSASRTTPYNGKREDTLYAICEVLVRGPCLTMQVVDHAYANKRAYAVADRDPSRYIAIPERDLRDAAATVRVSDASNPEQSD